MARPKKQIPPQNYYTVYNWMATELGLGGNELLAYAFIYSYSVNTGGQGCYFGGYGAMSLAIGCVEKTLRTVTTMLCKKGLIEIKKAVLENGLDRNYFRVCVNPLKELSEIERVADDLAVMETFSDKWEDLGSLSKSIKNVKADTNRVF